METKQSLSIANCFRQSISLTFSNFFAFLGAAILAWIFSVLSLGFLFPCLMTGLENMYIRAKAGEGVKATDVFIYRRKWWSLYIDAVVIGFLVVWPIALYFIVMLLVLMIPVVLSSFGFTPDLSIIIPFLYGGLLLMILLVLYRESRHLHALNLAAEFGLRGPESRHISRQSVKNKWKGTIFTILLAIALGFFWTFDPILTPIGALLLLPIIMGATSMAFLHDMGEKEEIHELVKKYKQGYRKELSKGVENPCPTCGNSNVRRAYIEDGGMGDWCPDCKMSLKKMRGLI